MGGLVRLCLTKPLVYPVATKIPKAPNFIMC
jgi:hypothetical protein